MTSVTAPNSASPDPALPTRIRRHAEAFNSAVPSGDWSTFAERLGQAAAMRFVGVPAGPFVGRAAIAAAYARQPPTDTLVVRAVDSSGDLDTVRFAWSAGGTGTMRLSWDGDLVSEIEVAFDGPEALR